MAVVLMTEDPDGAEGGWDNLWRRTYTRVYRVECSSRYDDEYTIRTTLDSNGVPVVPRVGVAFRIHGPWSGGPVNVSAVRDAGAFVQGHRYKRERAGPNPDGCTWLVTVDYGPYDTSVFTQSPTDWPTKIAFTAQQYERVIWVDQAGDAILNSAGDRFADPVTIDDSRPIITVTRNVPALGFDATLPDTYRDKVNLNTWNGFGAKIVKCNSIVTGQPTYDSNGGTYYYELTGVFEFNRDTWKKTILDQGYSTISLLDSTKRNKMLGDDGQPVSDPGLLNGSGRRLAVSGTPVFLEFDVYPAVDFSPLGINFASALGWV
jgi:hypothetical protein